MDQDDIVEGLQRAADTGLTHLGPDEVQVQPYYQGFGDAGGETRQWMFKARDDSASELEGELSALETQAARLLRKSEQRTAWQQPNEAEALKLDAEREAVLCGGELQEQIAAQTGGFMQQLREIAFFAKLPHLFGNPFGIH